MKLAPLEKGDEYFFTIEELDISEEAKNKVRNELQKWLNGFKKGCSQHKGDPCCCLFVNKNVEEFIKKFRI